MITGNYTNFDYRSGEKVFNQIKPYIEYSKAERCPEPENKKFCVYLKDNSLFTIYSNSKNTNIFYFINGKTEYSPKNSFAFENFENSPFYPNNLYVEPYTYNWNGKFENLKKGLTYSCTKDSEKPHYCTKWIQLNGWKIPKDYPW